jgi:hypothetical protein
MAEPFSATFIAALALLNTFRQTETGKKFIEGIVGHLGENVLDTSLEKINELRKLIWAKLRGNAGAEQALAAAEQGSEPALKDVAGYLKVAMKEDEAFAAQVQQMAQEIVIIGKIKGRNVQNISGGEGYQSIESNAPVIQGGSGHTITFNYGKD